MGPYNKYRLPNFKPYTKELKREDCSCGGHLCSIITSIPIDCIKNLHPKNDDWKEAWVKTFLKLAGYYLLEVKPNVICQRKGFERIFYPDHLIVYVLGIDSRESTWCCVYKNKIFHGQNLFDGFNGFDILNNFPIERMWLCVPIKKLKPCHK